MIKLKPGSILLFCLFILMTLTLQGQKAQEISRSILNFDNDWRFLKGDAGGAETPSFDEY
jgi:hypothetical protein